MKPDLDSARRRLARGLATVQWVLAYGVIWIALGVMDIAELVEASAGWLVDALDRSACRLASWGRVE
ncbi:MAG TPA: hypothetical protein PLJ34_02415 [Hyphomicrobiales bacterium]|nr:hypothetical protein [Hyphomicrobiales bacterium]